MSTSDASPDDDHPRPPTVSGVFGCFLALNVVSIVSMPADCMQGLRVLPLVFSVMAAEGWILPMFGAGCCRPVTVLMGPEQVLGEDAFALSQIHAGEIKKQAEYAATTWCPIALHYPSAGREIATPAGREALRNLLPADSVLIIYDLPGWLREPQTGEAFADLMKWLRELTDEGITVVTFEPPKSEGGLAALVKREDVITVDSDPAAPHDFSGGGCVIRRCRRGLYDESPLGWNFWYQVSKGKLVWGMENRPADDSLSKKRRELQHRQLEAMKHINGEMTQRELAGHLNVSDSTLYRLLKRIQEEKNLKWGGK